MVSAGSRLNALVIGLGSYYTKLRHGIRRYFADVQLADTRPQESFDLVDDEKSCFHQALSDLAGLSVDSSVDCIMLLTPPAYHVSHAEVLAKFKKPIFIEKPIATTSSEISRLGKVVEDNPRLYCSDFYPDVRAMPLLRWKDRSLSSWLIPLLEVTSGDERLWANGTALLGEIKGVEAKLLEGGKESGTFDGREWLWEPSQGGVLRDLMYHYFTLSSYLFDEDLIAEDVTLRSLRSNGECVLWSSGLGVAETYAFVKGRMASGIPFEFEVSKYWKGATERRFTLFGTRGSASMIFEKGNVLKLQRGNKECCVHLKGNYYDHVVRCFCDYVGSRANEPKGWKHAVRAVNFIENIRNFAALNGKPISQYGTGR